LNADAKKWIDHIVDRRYSILMGDANGVDKAVQRYLSSKNYDLVEIFCAGEVCRNNVGDWHTHKIEPNMPRKGFSFYAAKDRAMADEATAGFMLWDRESVGTLMNVFRLVRQNKRVILFIAPTRRVLDLKDYEDWTRLIETCAGDLRDRIDREVLAEVSGVAATDSQIQSPLH